MAIKAIILPTFGVQAGDDDRAVLPSAKTSKPSRGKARAIVSRLGNPKGPRTQIIGSL